MLPIHLCAHESILSPLIKILQVNAYKPKCWQLIVQSIHFQESFFSKINFFGNYKLTEGVF